MKRRLLLLFVSLALTSESQGQRTGILFGIVHSEGGEPVANLQLTISGSQGTVKVVTGFLGQYQINDLALGRYVITIESSAYALSSLARITVSSGQNRFNLVVTPVEGLGSGVLFGTVRLSDASPVPSVVLTVSGPDRILEVMTGPEGEYRVEGLHPGVYRVQVDDQTFMVSSDAEAIVSNGETHLDLTVGLHESVAVTAEAVAPTTVATNPGMSTTVVEQEQIEERQPSTVDLILQGLPGLTVSRQGGVGSPSFLYVRGGAPNYALVLVDGFPVNDPGGEFDFGKTLPLEFERVEVTRGAASSIYGGALSGVVHMITRQADSKEGNLFVKGEAGSYSWNRLQGGTSGRTDEYDWNIGALHLQTDNQEPNSAFSQSGVAGSLGIKAGEDTSVRIILRGETSTAGSPGQTAYIRPDLDASEEQSRLVVGATFNHSGGSADHQFRAGLSKTNKLSLNPEDSGPIDLEPPEGEASELRFQIPDFATSDGLKNDTQRLTLAYQAQFQTQRHLIIAGGDLENQTGELGSDTSISPEVPEGAPPFFGRFRLSGLSTPSRTNLAGFLQDRIIIRDDMLLTVGGRLERNGSFGTYALPRAAFSWSVGHSTTLKASAGIGLKEPSLEQSFGGNFRVQGNPDLQPERSHTLDAGIAQSFFGDQLWLEATVFHHEYKDQIVLGNLDVPTLETVLPEFTSEELRQIRDEIKTGLREPIRLEIDFDQFRPSYVNLGKTRARGVELSFGASPVPGTQFRTDYTLLDGLVLESSERGLELEEGSTLPNRPRHQFAFDAQSQIGRVTLGATLNYVGERLADVDFVSRALGITPLEAFTRLDLRGAVELSQRFEIYVVGENVLDAQYQEILGYPALGRAVRGGLRVDFSF